MQVIVQVMVKRWCTRVLVLGAGAQCTEVVQVQMWKRGGAEMVVQRCWCICRCRGAVVAQVVRSRWCVVQKWCKVCAKVEKRCRDADAVWCRDVRGCRGRCEDVLSAE